VLAPGGIANAFAEAVAVGTASQVVAVGSRSLERARAFADRHGIERAHGSYDELVADDGVDAVYVASPHSEHHDHALLAIAAGKPVLVEKAFTRSAAEAREVLDAATGKGLLAAEAMWSRYLPHYDVVRQAVTAGLLGDVVALFADHGQRLWPNGPARLSQPELAGGALLDLGVYPVSFADHVLGPATSVTAAAALTELTVDSTTSIVLRVGGAQAILFASMAAVTPCTAVVAGTEARLEIATRFYGPSTVRLVGRDGTVLDERDGRLPDDVRGFSFEAAEFARSLAAGATETTVMPHAATLRVMETMDEVRRQVGVRYPGE
jgi:predicted dehydrogenase